MSDTPKTDHTYDGIEQYDNPVPGWWKWIFVATIVYSPFYWVYYHGGPPGRSVEDHYGVASAANTRLQFAEIGDLKPDADTITKFLAKPNWVKVGQAVFKANCVSCHGRDAEGRIGPNLTDDAYKNVVKIEDIARIINNGAGAGAMPKWSNRLHVNEVVLVSAYVASLRGSNVDGGKAAEGRKIDPWPERNSQKETEKKTENGTDKQTEKVE